VVAGIGTYDTPSAFTGREAEAAVRDERCVPGIALIVIRSGPGLSGLLVVTAELKHFRNAARRR
jgi:hypothetical protein